jgi:hypothetical protein
MTPSLLKIFDLNGVKIIAKMNCHENQAKEVNKRSQSSRDARDLTNWFSMTTLPNLATGGIVAILSGCWLGDTMPALFEDDPEYPDLDCGECVTKRYLQLKSSADYFSKSAMMTEIKCDYANIPLPANVITIGRRVTPYLRIKIMSALDVFPTKDQIRTYQLFAEVKACSFRFDYKQKLWVYMPRNKSKIFK